MHAEGKRQSLPVILQAPETEQEGGRFPQRGSREDAIIYKKIILCSFPKPSNYFLQI